MALALGNLVMRQKTAGYSNVDDFVRAIRKEVPVFVELPTFRRTIREAAGKR
jgi:hypothetical protein